MPRLIGHKSNPFPAFVLLFVLGALCGGALVGEYAGLIDYIPNFGVMTAQKGE